MRFFLFSTALSFLAGCSTASPAVALRLVAPTSPPKDDGSSAKGNPGGEEHSAALEQLRVSPIAARSDKQASVLVPLPDAEHWTRVRFMTLQSLVGFRYGKEHHAIVAGFVTHVDDNQAPGACSKSFESWAMPFVEAFEVDVKHDPPAAFPWTSPKADKKAPSVVSILDTDPLVAKTATVLSRESYAAAWSAYPAWEKACLIVGVAVPMQGDDSRALDVRDRFVKDVLPKVIVTSTVEPKERY